MPESDGPLRASGSSTSSGRTWGLGRGPETTVVLSVRYVHLKAGYYGQVVDGFSKIYYESPRPFRNLLDATTDAEVALQDGLKRGFGV